MKVYQKDIPMAQRRNSYDEEFKKQAVLHHVGNSGTLAESASRFGITASMLSKWIERYSPESKAATAGAMNYEFEIRRLQSEVKSLKEIVGKAFLQKYTTDTLVESMAEEPEKIFAENGFSSDGP
jgi:transposase-like protein